MAHSQVKKEVISKDGFLVSINYYSAGRLIERAELAPGQTDEIVHIVFARRVYGYTTDGVLTIERAYHPVAKITPDGIGYDLYDSEAWYTYDTPYVVNIGKDTGQTRTLQIETKTEFDGSKTKTIKYLNADKLVMTERTTDLDDKLLRLIHYEYNDHKLLSKKFEYEGTKSTFHKYEYVYSTTGEWTTQTEYLWNGTTYAEAGIYTRLISQ